MLLGGIRLIYSDVGNRFVGTVPHRYPLPGISPACNAKDPESSSVSEWYHVSMAMTLRIPEELDERLDELAAAEQMSKSAFVLRALREEADRRQRRAAVGDAFDFVMSHDAEAMRRLADA